MGILQSGKTQTPGYLISKAYYTRALRSKEIAPEFATGNTQLVNRDSSFMTSAILKNFAMGNNRIAVDARVIDRKTSFVLKRFLLWSVVRGQWSVVLLLYFISDNHFSAAARATSVNCFPARKASFHSFDFFW